MKTLIIALLFVNRAFAFEVATPRYPLKDLLQITASMMNITLSVEKPLPDLKFESQSDLNTFQNEIEPQWGFRPEMITNVYVINFNRIYVIDDLNYYQKTHRFIDDSIVHELVHYFQIHYKGYTIGDLDEMAEMYAVDIQNSFRERYMSSTSDRR